MANKDFPHLKIFPKRIHEGFGCRFRIGEGKGDEDNGVEVQRLKEFYFLLKGRKQVKWSPLRVHDHFRMGNKGHEQGLPFFFMGFVDKSLKYVTVSQVDAVKIAYGYEGALTFRGNAFRTFCLLYTSPSPRD